MKKVLRTYRSTIYRTCSMIIFNISTIDQFLWPNRRRSRCTVDIFACLAIFQAVGWCSLYFRLVGCAWTVKNVTHSPLHHHILPPDVCVEARAQEPDFRSSLAEMSSRKPKVSLPSASSADAAAPKKGSSLRFPENMDDDLKEVNVNINDTTLNVRWSH